MASGVYNIAKQDLAKGDLDWENDDLRVLLVGAGYTPSATHQFVQDVVAQECSGGNYVRKTLASKTTALASGVAQCDAADTVWTALNCGTVSYAILFTHTGNDATARLRAWLDFTDLATNGGDFTLAWDAAGLVNIT